MHAEIAWQGLGFEFRTQIPLRLPHMRQALYIYFKVLLFDLQIASAILQAMIELTSVYISCSFIFRDLSDNDISTMSGGIFSHNQRLKKM